MLLAVKRGERFGSGEIECGLGCERGYDDHDGDTDDGG